MFSNFKSVIKIAKKEFIRFYLNPRIMVLGMLLLLINNLVIKLLIERADKFGVPLNIAEPFIAVGNSGALLMFIPAVFLILASDFPNIGKHTMFVIYRSGRLNWLFGQLLSALMSAITYIGIILAFSCVMTTKNGIVSSNWSDTVTKYGAVYPNERYNLTSQFLSSNLYNQLNFKEALFHTVFMLVLYLFLLCLIIFFFRILGMKTAGIATAFAIVACGVVTCSLKTQLMWLFPMANSISWLHFTQANREPVKPMSESYIYFGVFIFVGIVANIIAIKKSNINAMDD